jgi:putative component of membrane protein insertase Oxa1/YidC/SpoIIIJ protein YidD
MAKALALAAIRFYQRSISPRKGYCCAYAVHTGRGSCSTLGYRAIQRYGVWRGLAVLDARLYKCGATHRRHHSVGPLAAQAGFLDCGGCDAPGCDVPGDCDMGGGKGLNCFDACSCGDCDWRIKHRKKKEREQYVVVSPTTRLKR